ncbi:general transcription factor 3C polypeptide 6 [Phlebotomus argentipes]|uniref:general transcription factor 3C polypeptide 6 n=1 Tax=Phlebotomus argentipes TaxID=94469 RepID=UPI0028931C6A|nr:general transcription factor 3C polypeptide 6 [Phlebotomus argentipes]
MASVKTERDTEDADDCEEVYLYLDFNSIPLTDELNEPNLTLKIVGIESENPVVQINNKFFQGEYEDTVGTHLFFEEDPDHHEQQDPLYSRNPRTMFKYVNKSNKALMMRRIFLESRESENTSSDAIPVENSAKYQVTMTYQDTLCQLLKPGQIPPNVLSDCLDAKIKSTQEETEEHQDLESLEDRKHNPL